MVSELWRSSGRVGESAPSADESRGAEAPAGGFGTAEFVIFSSVRPVCVCVCVYARGTSITAKLVVRWSEARLGLMTGRRARNSPAMDIGGLAGGTVREVWPLEIDGSDTAETGGGS
jgi:hypothetical protein